MQQVVDFPHWEGLEDPPLLVCFWLRESDVRAAIDACRDEPLPTPLPIEIYWMKAN